MYRGWIALPTEPSNIVDQIVSECEIFLKWKNADGTYECKISDEGLKKLDKYWGEAYWGLEKE